VIREATPDDERVLRDLDRRVWSYLHTPVPLRDRPFELDGVLVSDVAEGIAGYVKLGALWPIDSVSHVLEIKGLAVDPRHQRRGVGRALVHAAIDHARQAGARKLTLRVLGHNAPARELYTACGFEVEGVLRGLFRLEGRYVDDVLMSIDIAAGRDERRQTTNAHR
jgi:ribosomal protein S18 acetylase RimI-like enzyme